MVSGSIDDFPHKNDEHYYSFVEFNEWEEGKELRLQIDESSTPFWFRHTSKELVLDLNPLDGGAYLFVRIN